LTLTVTLHFPGDGSPTDVTHLVRDHSKRISRRLMNDDRRSVIDFFAFSLKYNATVFSKLLAATDKIVTTVTDGATPVFKGYVAPTLEARAHERVDPIELEALDNSWKLDRPIQASFAYPSTVGGTALKICDPADTGNSIVHLRLQDAGYTIATDVAASCPTISQTIEHIAGTEGERNNREILDMLLSEYGYALFFDAEGKFDIYRWDKDTVTPTSTITSFGTEHGFRITKRDNEYDGFETEWSDLEILEDALLYRDNLPVDTSGGSVVFPGKAIAAGDYYPADGDVIDIYQVFRTEWLDLAYLSRESRLRNEDLALIASSNHVVTFDADEDVVEDSASFEAKRAKVLFQNTGAGTEKIYYFEIHGTALYRASRRYEKAGDGSTNPEKYVSEYIYDQASAQRHASAMHLARLYGDITCGFEDRQVYELGEVVSLQEPKTGFSQTAIIIEIDHEFDKPMWRYVAIGIAEYLLQPIESIGTLMDIIAVQQAITTAIASIALADAAQAITDAATAQATADGKVTTFYQATAPTAEGVGDLWVDTDDDRLYRWNGSNWIEIQDADIAQAIADAATAQSTADGKIVSFYQTSAPTAEGVGDLWVDTDDGNKLYRWSGSAWVDVHDAQIDQALADAAQAITDAATAQATADGKVTTFYQATAPTADGIGDLWIDTDTDRLYRWNGSN